MTKWPGAEPVTIKSLATSQPVKGKVKKVELLGHKGKLNWTQDAAAFKVQLPAEKPSDHAVTFKIALA